MQFDAGLLQPAIAPVSLARIGWQARHGPRMRRAGRLDRRRDRCVDSCVDRRIDSACDTSCNTALAPLHPRAGNPA
jgi:hypothetical protein